MLQTKLILLEGLPGAGKSSSTAWLGQILNQQGIACRWYIEEADPHPLPVLDMAIKGLPQKTIPLWEGFVREAAEESAITIFESRLWQNTALYMYMSEVDVGEIIEFHRQVCKVLTPLSPVLLYLDQDDTDSALRRMSATRGDAWTNQTLHETLSYPWFTSRGLTDFNGWIEFFEAWHTLAERLYADFPHARIKIQNAHEHWAHAYEQMAAFLQIKSGHARV